MCVRRWGDVLIGDESSPLANMRTVECTNVKKGQKTIQSAPHRRRIIYMHASTHIHADAFKVLVVVVL